MRIKILYKIHELDISTFDDFLDVWNPFLHHVVVMLPCSIRSKMAVVGGRRVGDGPKQYWNMNGMESNQMESNRFESFQKPILHNLLLLNFCKMLTLTKEINLNKVKKIVY